MVAAAIIGGAVVGGVASNLASQDAADTAAEAQTQAAATGEAGINARFQQLQTLLKPFQEEGQKALFAQSNLMGLNGNAPQQAAIDAIRQGPQFQAMLAEGENSILSNASATGGLRGGNTQAALSRYSPLLLANLIQQQYSNLGGLTSIGQNAAAGVGNAGVNTATTIAGLQESVGAAQAGAALANGRADANLYSSLGNAAGLYSGLGGFGRTGQVTTGAGIGNQSNPGFVGPQYDPAAFGNSFGAYS